VFVLFGSLVFEKLIELTEKWILKQELIKVGYKSFGSLISLEPFFELDNICDENIFAAK
jgi:hypothetical protein